MKIPSLLLLAATATVVCGAPGVVYIDQQFAEVRALIQNENYSAATHLLTELIKNFMGELDQSVEVEDMRANVSLLSKIKLIAEQTGSPVDEVRRFLESKILETCSNKLKYVHEAAKEGRLSDSITQLSDWYYIFTESQNFPKVTNAIEGSLKCLQYELKDLLSLSLLHGVEETFAREFINELTANWIDVSPRTELVTRDDLDVFFRRQISDLMFNSAPNTDPGSLIKAYVNGSGFCSLFKHPNDPTSDLNPTDKNDVKFAKIAYLIGNLWQVIGINLSDFHTEQSGLIRLFQVCKTFHEHQLDSNKRKLFISQLLNPSFYRQDNIEMSWQDRYKSKYDEVCINLIGIIDDERIFGSHIAGSETAIGYFLDECVDDLGVIWEREEKRNLFEGYWLIQIKQYVDSAALQFEDHLKLYDTLFLDNQTTIGNLLNAKLNKVFNNFLDVEIENLSRIIPSSIESGGYICHLFDSEANDVIYGPITEKLARFWSHGYRMSGKLFNKKLSRMQFVYLRAACKSIEDKYLQRQKEAFMEKYMIVMNQFDESVKNDHHDAIMLHAQLYDLASSANYSDVLDQVNFKFLTITWNLSISFLKLFDEANIVGKLVRKKNLKEAFAMLSHLYHLSKLTNDGIDIEVRHIVESKYQLFSSAIEQFEQIGQVQGDELVLKFADLHHFVDTHSDLSEFQPLLLDTYPSIEPIAVNLFSLRLLDEMYQFVSNKILKYKALFDDVTKTNDVRNDWKTTVSVGLFYDNLIKEIMSTPDKDPGPLIRAFVNGSGFCSIFMHPSDPTTDIDQSNENMVKFAKVAFLLGEIQEKTSYSIDTSENEALSLDRMMLFCRSFRKHPLDTKKRKIFLTSLLDSTRNSDMLSLIDHYDATDNFSACTMLFTRISDETFDTYFPSEETKSYFLDECADDLNEIWEKNILSVPRFRIFKLSLVNRWFSRAESFIKRQPSNFQLKDYFALLDSLILPDQASSTLSDLLDPRRNPTFDKYLQRLVDEVNDNSAVSAYHHGTGLCDMFVSKSSRMSRILGSSRLYWSQATKLSKTLDALKIHWNQGHLMRGLLLEGKLSSMRFVYLRVICNHLRARATALA